MERLAPLMRAAGAGEPPDLGIRKVAGNGTWISLPSFSVSGAQLDALKATLAELPKYRDSAYVVIDVRGNGGGSSHWGRQVIDGLYGAEFGKWLQAEADRKTKDAYVEFRVSQENADHFRNELPRLAAGAGKDSTDYRYFERIVADMDAALARKEVLLDDTPAQRAVFGPPIVEAGPKPATAYPGHVYFLTDALCASACLDFADLLLDAPNVVQVGEPTSGDTVYMDLGFMRLPSNAGGFSYATKVYRGRPRGHNVAYVPKHEWKGDVWRTSELEPWIGKIEAGR
jgi:hypothetical protein